LDGGRATRLLQEPARSLTMGLRGRPRKGV
jgi:hypothetical protein